MSAFRKSLQALERAEECLRQWAEESAIVAFEEASRVSDELQLEVELYSRRLEEKDPLTKEPRYGPQMRTKVQDFLSRLEQLGQAVEEAAPAAASRREEEDGLAKVAAKEEEERRRTQDEEHQKRMAVEQDELAKRIGSAPATRPDEFTSSTELHAAAEAARQQRKAAEEAAELERARVREEREAACREWQREAGSGSEAFQRHLADLLKELERDLSARDSCLRGLHVIISNRTRKPESEEYKILRCGNRNFLRDIGRFESAKRCLAAVGFQLKLRTNEVKDADNQVEETLQQDEEILEMIEPDPEANFDGWAAWYDTLSGAVSSLQDAMEKRSIKPAREAAI